MRTLHIEEFESRNLLNGAGFLAGPLLPPPFAAEAAVLRVTENLVLVEMDTHAGWYGWGWAIEEGMEAGLLRNFGHPGFASRNPLDPGPRGPGHEEPGLARPLGSDSPPTWAGTNQPDVVPPASSLLDGRFFASGKPPAAPVPVSSGTAANGTSAEFVVATLGQSSRSPRPLVENAVGARGFPATALSPVPFAGGGAPGKEPDSGFAGIPQPQTPTSSDQPAMPATPGQGQDGLLPSPRGSEALAVLPSLNLSALEQGLQQFLQGLEKLGPRWTGNETATTWWPWIVAGVTAAAACEITRRELRRLTWSAEGGQWNALRLFTLSERRPRPDQGDRS